ncbi:MAG: hypothetical protein JRH11_06065 [Deltaproteobacteria bacterium]|nr:hypothetical protein [Deltaproteobacteria bacterium]
MLRLVAAFVVPVLCAACASAAPPLALDPREPGPGFEIRMHRDAEVGDVYRLVERWSLERIVEITRAGAASESVTLRRRAELAADVLVVAVTSDGKELERRFTVRRFSYDWNGVPGAPIPEGSHIRVIGARDGRGVIQWDGEEELPPDAVAALRSVVSTVIRPGTDDEVFGTASRQAIGGRWAIDATRASGDLSSVPGLAVAPGQVRGEGVLIGATQVAGIDCLVVDTTLHADLREMPGPVAGAVVEAATLDVRISGHYPVERGLPQLATERETRVGARGTVPALEGEDGEAPPGSFVMRATTTASRRVVPR